MVVKIKVVQQVGPPIKPLQIKNHIYRVYKMNLHEKALSYQRLVEQEITRAGIRAILALQPRGILLIRVSVNRTHSSNIGEQPRLWFITRIYIHHKVRSFLDGSTLAGLVAPTVISDIICETAVDLSN